MIKTSPTPNNGPIQKLIIIPRLIIVETNLLFLIILQPSIKSILKALILIFSGLLLLALILINNSLHADIKKLIELIIITISIPRVPYIKAATIGANN